MNGMARPARMPQDHVSRVPRADIADQDPFISKGVMERKIGFEIFVSTTLPDFLFIQPDDHRPFEWGQRDQAAFCGGRPFIFPGIIQAYFLYQLGRTQTG